mgnify:CR=1 FL=1
MTIRERQERDEEARLSPYAALSSRSAGRAHPISTCDLRTCYQRDRDRIIHCKSFRRLKYKTQVFLTPMGDHYRTRLTHTLDVAQISRSIARALSLNEDLAEAIALGHDLGHTPFGHVGERVLDKLSPTGFEHNIQSLRVVDVIEKEGRGLNLTEEVRDGILQHKSTGHPATLEGAAVSLPLRREGCSRRKSFFIGQASGFVEPIAGVLGALLAVYIEAVLPFALSFAAGAMILVAVHELIPECQRNQEAQPYAATMGIVTGFALMMLLDVMLG